IEVCRHRPGQLQLFSRQATRRHRRTQLQRDWNRGRCSIRGFRETCYRRERVITGWCIGPDEAERWLAGQTEQVRSSEELHLSHVAIFRNKGDVHWHISGGEESITRAWRSNERLRQNRRHHGCQQKCVRRTVQCSNADNLSELVDLVSVKEVPPCAGRHE